MYIEILTLFMAGLAVICCALIVAQKYRGRCTGVRRTELSDAEIVAIVEKLGGRDVTSCITQSIEATASCLLSGKGFGRSGS